MHLVCSQQANTLDGSSPEHEPVILLASNFKIKRASGWCPAGCTAGSFGIFDWCPSGHWEGGETAWLLWRLPLQFPWRDLGSRQVGRLNAETVAMLKDICWDFSLAKILRLIDELKPACESPKQEALVQESVQLWLSRCAASCLRCRKW